VGWHRWGAMTTDDHGGCDTITNICDSQYVESLIGNHKYLQLLLIGTDVTYDHFLDRNPYISKRPKRQQRAFPHAFLSLALVGVLMAFVERIGMNTTAVALWHRFQLSARIDRVMVMGDTVHDRIHLLSCKKSFGVKN